MTITTDPLELGGEVSTPEEPALEPKRELE
jgi:hypothetical protein